MNFTGSLSSQICVDFLGFLFFMLVTMTRIKFSPYRGYALTPQTTPANPYRNAARYGRDRAEEIKFIEGERLLNEMGKTREGGPTP